MGGPEPLRKRTRGAALRSEASQRPHSAPAHWRSSLIIASACTCSRAADSPSICCSTRRTTFRRVPRQEMPRGIAASFACCQVPCRSQLLVARNKSIGQAASSAVLAGSGGRGSSAHERRPSSYSQSAQLPTKPLPGRGGTLGSRDCKSPGEAAVLAALPAPRVVAAFLSGVAMEKIATGDASQLSTLLRMCGHDLVFVSSGALFPTIVTRASTHKNIKLEC